MANQTLTKSIEVLEDGKLRAITTKNEIVYIQPTIVVDAYDNNENLRVRGVSEQEVVINTTVSSIDSVAFSGTFDSVEYCSSDDTTADDWGGRPVIEFADETVGFFFDNGHRLG